MLRPILISTAVSGTLDILFAMILTVVLGRQVDNMLRFVASGPLPKAPQWGAIGAALGLVVHFMLMAIMATIFVLAARRIPDMLDRPLKWGVIYGLITYVAMNWLVLPLRFGVPLPPKALSVATQLFAHVALVGTPFSLITARTLQPRSGAERVRNMSHAGEKSPSEETGLIS
jgi:hypothetical protein